MFLGGNIIFIQLNINRHLLTAVHAVFILLRRPRGYEADIQSGNRAEGSVDGLIKIMGAVVTNFKGSGFRSADGGFQGRNLAAR